MAAVLALGGAVVAAPHVAGQSAPTVGIDMEITGNNDSTVGAIQNCAELSKPGDTLTFDLIIEGISSADKIAGYQVDIDYDASVIKVTKVIGVDGTPTDEMTGGPAAGTVSMISRIDSLGGTHFLNLSEMVPDSDGSFTAAAIDGTLNPYPPDNHEDGEGVLARITVQAVGTGVSTLIIAGPAGGADGNPDLIIMGGAGALQGKAIPVGNVLNAAVSVGATCTPPPPTTAPGSQAPLPGTPAAGETPQPGAPAAGETPQPGAPAAGETPEPGAADAAATPQPGAPGADTQADGQPRTGADAQTPGPGTPGAGTPGPGTPVLGGTPVTGDEGDAGGEATAAEESDGGGLSAGAWAAIGAGIAAAAVAASGAGWFALRRRRARGTPTSGGETGSE